MDKQKLIQAFQQQILGELETAKKAARAAHEAAIHTESKAEDQYDTRGLEASYLAGAQSKRVAELEELLTIYQTIDIKKFEKETPIAATALVELHCDETGKVSRCLMMPKGGGMGLQFEGETILVVTPQSPLGGGILGRKVGDSIDVKVQASVREYEIVGVL